MPDVTTPKLLLRWTFFISLFHASSADIIRIVKQAAAFSTQLSSKQMP